MRDIRVFLFFVCLLFKIPLFILEGEREIEHGGEGKRGPQADSALSAGLEPTTLRP